MPDEKELLIEFTKAAMQGLIMYNGVMGIDGKPEEIAKKAIELAKETVRQLKEC